MSQSSLFAPEHLKAAPNPGEFVGLKEKSAVCVACRLHEGRRSVVFGAGCTLAPRIAFVGEAPGETEDREGVPFIGRAGKLLDKMIFAMGLTRDQVFVTNIVMCRPPENRPPKPDEVSACSRYLVGQLRSVCPEVIVALGATAAQALLKSKKGISELRGKWQDWGGIPLMPTYHPAFLLRNPAEKKACWLDLKQVMTKLQLTSEHVFGEDGEN